MKSLLRRLQASGRCSLSCPRLRSECAIFGLSNELFASACARMGYIHRSFRAACNRKHVDFAIGSSFQRCVGVRARGGARVQGAWRAQVAYETSGKKEVQRAGNQGMPSLLWKTCSSLRKSVSPLLQGAWAGRLVHFSGLDVLGTTAGVVARLLQDREVELWEGRRIVTSLGDDGPVRINIFPLSRFLIGRDSESYTRRWTTPISPSPTRPSVSSTPLHAPRRCAIGSPQSTPICSYPCLRNRCAAPKRPCSCYALDTRPLTWMRFWWFAGAYRTCMVPSDGALRVRWLGTRALLRVARRLARFPWDQDVRRMLERALLTEFLSATEKAGVEELLEDAGIKKISPAVCTPARVWFKGQR
jgi:hypothetical protein